MTKEELKEMRRLRLKEYLVRRLMELREEAEIMRLRKKTGFKMPRTKKSISKES